MKTFDWFEILVEKADIFEVRKVQNVAQGKPWCLTTVGILGMHATLSPTVISTILILRQIRVF